MLNGKNIVYLRCHDFFDHMTQVYLIMGVVLVDSKYLNGQKNLLAIEVLKVNKDYPVDRINVCYMINEILTPEVNGDFYIR